MPKPITLPLSIDEHAEIYLTLKATLDATAEALEKKKAELLKLVNKTGDIPSGADKSLRIEGDLYVITASYGHSSSIDNDVVGKIQGALAENHTPSLFKQLFKSKVSYQLAPTAQVVLESLPNSIQELFALVVKVKPRDPSLRVEPKKKAGK